VPRRISLDAVLLKFRTGELSAGAASEFAGLDRYAFAAEGRRRGIPLIDHPAEELKAEFSQAKPLAPKPNSRENKSV
jgi:predicted HTH domain antitoxin